MGDTPSARLEDSSIGLTEHAQISLNSPVAIPSNRDRTLIGLLLAAGIAGYNLGGSCQISKESDVSECASILLYSEASMGTGKRSLGTGWPFCP